MLGIDFALRAGGRVVLRAFGNPFCDQFDFGAVQRLFALGHFRFAVFVGSDERKHRALRWLARHDGRAFVIAAL